MIGFNNKKIGFIVDSSSNIKPGQFEDVEVVPLQISVNDNGIINSYKDGVNFSTEQLKDLLDSNKEVKTAQASMPDMMMATEKMCGQYDQVYVLPIHKNLSGNMNTWNIIKDDYTNLNVVMSCDIGASFIWTLEEIKDFLTKQEGNEQLVQEYIDKQIIPNRVGWLMVNNLDQLVKGGRVSNIKAAIAKLFKIKPIILFDANGLTNLDKAKNYPEYFIICQEYLKKYYPGKKVKRTILFNPLDENAAIDFNNFFYRHFGNQYKEKHHFPSVIVSHTGIDHVAIYVELE